ncbi:hypothetical protein EON80_02530 [bacterium]|nr:MAG: hypothetical protein EON80_02530 [bacterium]
MLKFPSYSSGLALTLLACGLAVPSAHAEVLTVSNNSNSGPGSLRWALDTANSTAAPDTIVIFNSVASPIVLSGSELVINSDIDIQGPGSEKLTLDGGGYTRRFFTITGGNVKISGLNFSRGRRELGGAILNRSSKPVLISNCNFSGNSAWESGGGAIYNENSTQLSVSGCTFSNNFVYSPQGYQVNGGAIYNRGTLNLGECTFNDNAAGATVANRLSLGAGGAVYNAFFAKLLSTNNKFTANLSNQFGGGIANFGTITLNRDSFSTNRARLNGGGVYQAVNQDGKIEKCTFTGNSTEPSGGGGAISNSGFLYVYESSFASNSANYGGAVCSLSDAPESTPRLSLLRNSFIENKAISLNNGVSYFTVQGRGGAVFSGGQWALTGLANNTFYKNSVTGTRLYQYRVGTDRTSGGAIHLASGRIQMFCCTLVGNFDNTSGGYPSEQIGTLTRAGGIMTSANNVFIKGGTNPPFWGYSDPTASGNVDKNFSFDTLAGAGLEETLKVHNGIQSYFPLKLSSPLLDVGLLDASPVDDIRALPRPAGSAPDVGAFELQDAERSPHLSISGGAVSEGHAGTRTLFFQVNLSMAHNKPVTVKYATATAPTNAATINVDYVPITLKTLTFPAGSTYQTIEVPILGDRIDEVDEQIQVKLSAPVNAKISTAVATGTIIDDDLEPLITAKGTGTGKNLDRSCDGHHYR